jgi:PIN domain nuclease of toxin-antitoxin system
LAAQTEDLFKSQNYQFEPLRLEILKTASEINDIPELHDRVIAATARYLDLPLITNDPAIRASEFVNILQNLYSGGVDGLAVIYCVQLMAKPESFIC